MTPEVILLEHTPNPTRLMGLAARLCYTQGQTIKGLNENMTDEACEKLVKKILSNRHNGVLEHPVFTFGIESVSRDFTHQLVRHRNTSYDQQSLHYTLAGEDMEVAAPVSMTDEEKAEWNAVKDGAFKIYWKLVRAGHPREEVRHILPGGIETKILATANLRQWLRFIELRACPVNVQEAVVVAHKIRNHLVGLMPYLRDYAGPTCISGVCNEGRKFCNAPWVVPCKIQGDGLNDMVNSKEEAKAWQYDKCMVCGSGGHDGRPCPKTAVIAGPC